MSGAWIGRGIDLLVHRSVLLATLSGIAVYLALDYVSFLESFRGLAITPWSPASGVALALVLLAGIRSAGVVLLAPPLAGILVRSGAVPAPLHLAEGVTIGGSYLLVGMLVRRLGRVDLRLQTIRDVLILMLAAFAAAATAAFCYVGVLRLTGFVAADETLEAFGRFLVGDLIGMLIVTPTLLLAVNGRLRPVSLVDLIAQLATILMALGMIFLVPHSNELQLFYLLFVPLVWSALRTGISGAAVTLCAIQIGLILTVGTGFSAAPSIVPYQVLMIWLAASGLIFGVVVAQQRAATTRMQYQQLALDRALRVRAMGEVATSIAHEVNQPLTSIKALAGVLRHELAKSEQGACQDVVEKIRSECDRASRIIRATRDALRQQVTHAESIAVLPLLAELEDLVTDRLAALNVRLLKEISPSATEIVGDRTQITQALYNLLDNSLQAIEESGRPGTITVKVAPTGGNEVEFDVRDTGAGFPPDVYETGLPPLVSMKPQGSGIGLSIVRSVAEAHGGHLTFERSGDETSARFTVAREK